MAKSKYSAELKITIAKAYLNGEESYDILAHRYGVGATAVNAWVRRYKEQGEEGFIKGIGNARYSAAFKQECIEAVLSGQGTVDDIVVKYHISSRSVLWRWIMVYNANRTLKDYDPKREVYMAEARRKTTIEERKEIVTYCIEHGRDYKNTASLYNVSYSQVYTWVKKYDHNVEEGLVDKRGRRKTDDEIDELERLRRENLRLKRQLEEKDMVVELLKK